MKLKYLRLDYDFHFLTFYQRLVFQLRVKQVTHFLTRFLLREYYNFRTVLCFIMSSHSFNIFLNGTIININHSLRNDFLSKVTSMFFYGNGFPNCEQKFTGKSDLGNIYNNTSACKLFFTPLYPKPNAQKTETEFLLSSGSLTKCREAGTHVPHLLPLHYTLPTTFSYFPKFLCIFKIF